MRTLSSLAAFVSLILTVALVPNKGGGLVAKVLLGRDRRAQVGVRHGAGRGRAAAERGVGQPRLERLAAPAARAHEEQRVGGLEDRTVRQRNPSLNPRGWRDGSSAVDAHDQRRIAN